MAIRAIWDRDGVQQPVTAQDVQAVLQALQKAGKRANKYAAVRTTVDGEVFDSKKEANYWCLLKLRQRAGHIRNLKRQSVHELHAPNGEVLGVYRDDFSFEELVKGRWLRRTIDVKSKATRTALYKWKRRHVMAEYKVQILEV